jgi:hypothetical protein
MGDRWMVEQTRMVASDVAVVKGLSLLLGQRVVDASEKETPCRIDTPLRA